ncbi:MAG: hypothetical protein ACI83L_002889, partial [Cryomorphaceae bacterium]
LGATPTSSPRFPPTQLAKVEATNRNNMILFMPYRLLILNKTVYSDFFTSVSH